MNAEFSQASFVNMSSLGQLSMPCQLINVLTQYYTIHCLFCHPNKVIFGCWSLCCLPPGNITDEKQQ